METIVIRNTTADFNDGTGADAMLLLATAMHTGSADEFIGAQEKAGQAQLVNSDRLPVDTGRTDEEFLALGFTFGDPDPKDPIFRPATLPAGWSRQASDHSMGSSLVDELGRKRVGIFYKAAFYDRHANMYVIGVRAYISDRLYYGEPVVSDDTWATPAAITEAARAALEYAEKQIVFWTEHRGSESEYVAQYTNEREQYNALIARFGTEAGA